MFTACELDGDSQNEKLGGKVVTEIEEVRWLGEKA